MLGRDLQLAADMVLREFAHVLWRFDREVVAHTGGDQNLLDAGQRPGLPIQLDQRRMIGVEIRAYARIDARRAAAGAFDLAALARQPVHVRGRATQIGDHAGETRDAITDLLDLREHRLLRAALDDAALVFGNGAERAAAEAAALDRHREADHLVGGNVGLAVARMRAALIR